MSLPALLSAIFPFDLVAKFALRARSPSLTSIPAPIDSTTPRPGYPLSKEYPSMLNTAMSDSGETPLPTVITLPIFPLRAIAVEVGGVRDFERASSS